MNREKIKVLQQEDEEEGIGHLKITRLIDIGKRKSYVTIDDILKLFPEAENPGREAHYQDFSKLRDRW